MEDLETKDVEMKGPEANETTAKDSLMKGPAMSRFRGQNVIDLTVDPPMIDLTGDTGLQSAPARSSKPKQGQGKAEQEPGSSRQAIIAQQIGDVSREFEEEVDHLHNVSSNSHLLYLICLISTSLSPAGGG
jgi:hypothetical protein